MKIISLPPTPPTRISFRLLARDWDSFVSGNPPGFTSFTCKCNLTKSNHSLNYYYAPRRWGTEVSIDFNSNRLDHHFFAWFLLNAIPLVMAIERTYFRFPCHHLISCSVAVPGKVVQPKWEDISSGMIRSSYPPIRINYYYLIKGIPVPISGFSFCPAPFEERCLFNNNNNIIPSCPFSSVK